MRMLYSFSSLRLTSSIIFTLLMVLCAPVCLILCDYRSDFGHGVIEKEISPYPF